jgi:succinoglycan biosynthesis protein ExoV
MKLFYYAGTDEVKNFGDELNHHVWPQLLPGIFDEDDGTQFVGIGTLLNDQLTVATRTVVFGSGVGYYGPPTRASSWEIYCVRGPLSARALELAPTAAITDPGILATRVFECGAEPRRTWRYAFMPHWQSEPSDYLPICNEIGFGFIDPRWDPARVIHMLRRTEVLLTEAMHGAILADALRIPWVAVRTRTTIRRFKWEDWCQSMQLDYCPVSLPTIWPRPAAYGAIRRARRWSRFKVIAWMLRRAASRARPSLSRPQILRSRFAQLDERLDEFRRRERWSPLALRPPA